MNETPPLPIAQHVSADFSSMPLDELIDLPVHEMTPDELAAYVQRCHLLATAAQTRRAAMRTEGTKLGAERTKGKSKKQSNVDKALAMLDLLNKL